MCDLTKFKEKDDLTLDEYIVNSIDIIEGTSHFINDVIELLVPLLNIIKVDPSV